MARGTMVDDGALLRILVPSDARPFTGWSDLAAFLWTETHALVAIMRERGTGGAAAAVYTAAARDLEAELTAALVDGDPGEPAADRERALRLRGAWAHCLERWTASERRLAAYVRSYGAVPGEGAPEAEARSAVIAELRSLLDLVDTHMR